MVAAGYSGKSLTQKLGVKPGDIVRPIDAPGHYAALLDPLPEGARLDDSAQDPAIVHAFVRSASELETLGPDVVALPAPGGAIWISWPKKSSAMFVDLTEDGVRRVMLPTGWVDVKVCAVDADWSGLKFLRRRPPSRPRVHGGSAVLPPRQRGERHPSPPPLGVEVVYDRPDPEGVEGASTDRP